MLDIMALADDVNAWIAEVAPLTAAKNPETLDQVQAICTTALQAFRLLTLYLQPVLPQLAKRVEAFLNGVPLTYASLDVDLFGHRIEPFKALLTRIEMDQVQQMIQPEATSQSESLASAPSSPEHDVEPLAQTCTIDDFNKIDLRVVTIVDAKAVIGADKLLELTLDLCDHTRTVFSGIKSAYDPATLIGRQTVMIANLAPRTMKFGISEGMVLAAGPGGSDIYLLSPDPGANAGQRIR